MGSHKIRGNAVGASIVGAGMMGAAPAGGPGLLEPAMQSAGLLLSCLQDMPNAPEAIASLEEGLRYADKALDSLKSVDPSSWSYRKDRIVRGFKESCDQVKASLSSSHRAGGPGRMLGRSAAGEYHHVMPEHGALTASHMRRPHAAAAAAHATYDQEAVDKLLHLIDDLGALSREALDRPVTREANAHPAATGGVFNHIGPITGPIHQGAVLGFVNGSYSFVGNGLGGMNGSL